MHLKHLQIIVQVGQLGSISKTAEKLYLSQPYISRILRALEEELEIVIFRRTKQGVEPTDVGKMFLREAGRILSEVRDLQMTYQSATQELEKLSVHAVPTSYAEIALIRLLRQIGDRQQRRFIYAEEKSYEVIENVSNGDADIGVLHCGRAQSQAIQGLLAAKNLCYKHIAWMARCVMVRQDHPLTRLGRPVTGEDLYDYAPVMYGLAADYYGGSDDFSAAYQDYFDMRRFCRQIKVSSRGAVHGMLR
ncbi:MAG: LysR family transcriptional regulator, partial [Oscillospiraceae bacterium]|nr:LysR family transcriptional regulator [Oscillospiraceae bacterium]